MEVLRQNATHRVVLVRDTAQLHQAHHSLGTYRVVDIRSNVVVFRTANRDKAFGVFEFLSAEDTSPR